MDQQPPWLLKIKKKLNIKLQVKQGKNMISASHAKQLMQQAFLSHIEQSIIEAAKQAKCSVMPVVPSNYPDDIIEAAVVELETNGYTVTYDEYAVDGYRRMTIVWAS